MVFEGARSSALATRRGVQQSVLTISLTIPAVYAEGVALAAKRKPPFPAGSEVELAGLEPATSWVRSRRSPN